MANTNNTTKVESTDVNTREFPKEYYKSLSQSRRYDIEDACEMFVQGTESDCRANELAAHLIISVLSSVKETISITIDEHASHEDDEKNCKIVCGVLDTLINLYECNDENFDLFDYIPTYDDAEDLVLHLAEKMLKLF